MKLDFKSILCSWPATETMIIDFKSHVLNSVYFSVLKSLIVCFLFQCFCINPYETVLSTTVNMIKILLLA